LVAAAGVAALGGVAVAYDSSRDDLVAQGVRVAGVDVGGLREDAARRRLQSQLARPLERPVRVAVAGHRFRLTPTRAQLSVDAEGMARAAVERSRAGWLPGRVWRALTGGDVRVDLPARVGYSARAVRGFVRHIEHTVNRPPRDAEIKLATASLPAIPSRRGLKVIGRERLQREVAAALASPGGGRSVRASVKVLEPKVTTAELGDKYPYFITIDRPAFSLRFFKHLRLAKTYTIAVGRIGLETPAGLYHVESKVINPAWHVPNSPWAGDLAGRVIPPGPDDPLKARWLGIFDGAGIHGTDDIGSLGTAASHGCIRMSIPDVEELYDRVPLRTPVYIQ
jgi:lipoprotein-anchoring transpeptidase ErfK/SrfK